MTTGRRCSGLEVGREREGASEGSCTEECARSDAGSGEGREMSKPADGNGEGVRMRRLRESERVEERQAERECLFCCCR